MKFTDTDFASLLQSNSKLLCHLNNVIIIIIILDIAAIVSYLFKRTTWEIEIISIASRKGSVQFGPSARGSPNHWKLKVKSARLHKVWIPSTGIIM